MEPLYRIELLGGFRVRQGERLIPRFRTHKAGALLAYLAYYPERSHHRETLVGLLWPESSPDAARNSLSTALSSLRHQLEPPGIPAGTVLRADRFTVGLQGALIRTDVAEFEERLQRAEQATSTYEQTQQLREALHLYAGPLLPGYFEEWIPAEAQRLLDRYLQATRRLVRSLAKSGQISLALDYARRAAAADPLREDVRRDLMRLLVAAGQPAEALQVYGELESRLRREMGILPTAAIQRLARQIQHSHASSAPTPDIPQVHAPSEMPAAPAASPPVKGTLTPFDPARPLDSTARYPTGTVTFLLLDAPAGAAQDEAAQVGQRQSMGLSQQILPIVRRYGGYPFEEAGEAVCGVFQSVAEAMDCALACRQALEGQTTQRPTVRIALHTGNVPAELRSYMGTDLQHTARILQATHDGQILCSETTGSLLRHAYGAGIPLQNLGVFRLQGEIEGETLFQVNDPQMPAREFPPPRTAAGYISQLPLPLTRLIGREDERQRLHDLLLLPSTRLVTLRGPGGIGKTRLAIEVARHLVERLQGAVWFVPLADLSEGDLIADAIVKALQIPLLPQISAQQQALTALSRQPCLLVLDNLEHLVEAGARLVQTLLEGTPTLTCLVTSRRALELGSEHEFVVMPLPVPTSSGGEGEKLVGEWGRKGEGETKTSASIQHSALNTGQEKSGRSSSISASSSPLLPFSLSPLLSYPSVQLFVERAQLVHPEFQLTPNNVAAVGQLCASLEGIPLALELAASRTQVLSVSQLLAQLDRRFDLLVSRRRDLDARHRTLRATIDLSYDLLSDDLKRFFRRLTVFRGGWDLAAAEFVCSTEERVRGRGSGVREESRPTSANEVHPEAQNERWQQNSLTPDPRPLTPDVLDLLAQLRENSLIVTAEEGKGMRFRMLETLREYGWEKLKASGEDASLRDRHLDYYLALAEAAEPQLAEAEQVGWLERLEAEHDNLRAALEWSLKSKYEGGRMKDESDSIHPSSSRLLPSGEASLRLVGALWPFWNMRGYVSEGRNYLAEALGRKEGAGRTRIRVKALFGAGMLDWSQGNIRTARAFFEECLEISQELGYKPGIASALNGLGIAAWNQGDYETARRLYEQNLAIQRELGSKRGIAHALNDLGNLACVQRDYARARALIEESLAIRREVGNKLGIAGALLNLGDLTHDQGDHEAAKALYNEGLEIAQESGSKQGVANALNALGILAAEQGDYAAASALLEQNLAIQRELGSKRGIANALNGLGIVACAQRDYARARALVEESLSNRRELGNRQRIAESLEAFADLALIEGQPARAVRLLGAAETMYKSIGTTLTPNRRKHYDRQLAQARTALSDAAFASAWAKGQAMTLEQAVEYALQSGKTGIRD